MSATVSEVREQLLALSRYGDELRGDSWFAIEVWHIEVTEYVRSVLGDGPAGDVASRLRLNRGATQAEKEANAIAFVKDWLGTQAAALTEDKINPAVTCEVHGPALEVVEFEEVADESDVPVVVAAELETDDGDIWPKD